MPHRTGSKPFGELAADGAGHGRAARHADHGAGVAGDVPLAGFGVGRVAGVGFVELDVFLGDFTGRNGEKVTSWSRNTSASSSSAPSL